MPAQGWHKEGQNAVVRSWLGVKALHGRYCTDRRTGSGSRFPFPEGWCALVLVAVFTSFTSLSWEAVLWSLFCLDSNKKLIFEMSFLFYLFHPPQSQIRQENATLKHQKCVWDEAYGSFIMQNLSPVCSAIPIKYLCCGLQQINFCVKPPLLSFLLLPFLILQYL